MLPLRCSSAMFHVELFHVERSAETRFYPATIAPCSLPPRAAGPPRPAEKPWAIWLALGRYLTQSEVHTYAFSVAANAILSLFPFIVLMFTVARRVLHSQSMVSVIGNMLHYFLPANQDFVVRNMSLLVHPAWRRPARLVSYASGFVVRRLPAA